MKNLPAISMSVLFLTACLKISLASTKATDNNLNLIGEAKMIRSREVFEIVFKKNNKKTDGMKFSDKDR